MKEKELFAFLDAQHPSLEQMEKTCGIVKQAMVQMQQQRISYRRFLHIQLRFISPWIWGMQIFLCGLFILFAKLSQPLHIIMDTHWMLYALSLFPAFVVAITIMETFKSLSYHMWELERGTRFSLCHVILGRMLLVGMGDLFMFSIAIVFGAYYIQVPLIKMILYLFVPFNMCVGGSLMILHLQKFSHGIMSAVVFPLLYGLGNALLSSVYPIYTEFNFGIWMLLLVISLLYILYELYVVLNKLRKQEVALTKRGGVVWNS